MNRHPKATNLALLIDAGRFRGIPEIDDSVHDSIAGFLSDYSDEHKADLYAQIIEDASAYQQAKGQAPGFLAIEKIVNNALWKSEAKYGNALR